MAFRSGQVRLVRAAIGGGSGIHIIHGMSSIDSDDSSNFPSYFHENVARPPGMSDEQTDRQTGRQREREGGREGDRQIEIETERQTDRYVQCR